jgi:hypothetical protein
MKKLAVSLTTMILLSGCASYDASPLNTLSSEMVVSQSQNGAESNDILVGAKAFDKADCKKYLDRDVISKGYQPVQLYIQNNSDKDYIFSLNRVSVPSARPEEVADKVHTSTVGRAAGYGAAAWFTFGILAVPAIVDGVKSANANDSLDSDFSAKVARDQLILKHSHFNKLLFVPVNEYQQTFSITLIEQESKNPKIINVSVMN